MINYTTGSTISFGAGWKAAHQIESLFETLTYDVTESIEDAIARCVKGGTLLLSVTVKEKE